jgi:hypothetical protein
VKFARERIGDVVRQSRDVIEAWYVSVRSLMDAKETEEIRRRGSGGGAPFLFPEHSAEVVPFGKDRPFSYIEAGVEDIEVEETACKFEVGVGDAPRWV